MSDAALDGVEPDSTYLDTYFVGCAMPDQSLLPHSALAVCLSDEMVAEWKKLPGIKAVSHQAKPADSDVAGIVFDMRAHLDNQLDQLDQPDWTLAKDNLYNWFKVTRHDSDVHAELPVLIVCMPDQLDSLRAFFDGRLMRNAAVVF